MSTNYFLKNHFSKHSLTYGGKGYAVNKPAKKRGLRMVIVGIFVLGGWYVLSSGYMLAKAHLSQWLIADAWALTLKDGDVHPPWSWADTHPVAKLSVPSLNQSSYILAGASGRNMAFGPAHSYQSGMPGEDKTTVFSGHNDSHFSYLSGVSVGDVIEVETLQGKFSYQVNDLRIVDSRIEQIVIQDKDQLVLTTCYPFDALSTGGPLRFQITAERI
ncbi:class GN sortase [Marinicella rhabdoformis]|uniref:class GN sortase n=1 Tax=Marinicella rhabdoformis TaxID=2580566 RepID=UPI0012AEDA67|nr:class GN sortase [Marinicella rhabdoformis]